MVTDARAFEETLGGLRGSRPAGFPRAAPDKAGVDGSAAASCEPLSEGPAGVGWSGGGWIGMNDMVKKKDGDKRKQLISAGRPGVPNPIDIHVGGRVRLRRTLLGLSQGQLGKLIGLTFQQVQKYESGENRLTAARLWEIARSLDQPLEYFFRELPPLDGEAVPNPGLAEGPDPLAQIDDPDVKSAIAAVIESYLDRK